MVAPPPKGMLTLKALEDKIHSGEIDTILAVFPDLYGRLIGNASTATSSSTTSPPAACTPATTC